MPRKSNSLYGLPLESMWLIKCGKVMMECKVELRLHNFAKEGDVGIDVTLERIRVFADWVTIPVRLFYHTYVCAGEFLKDHGRRSAASRKYVIESVESKVRTSTCCLWGQLTKNDDGCWAVAEKWSPVEEGK